MQSEEGFINGDYCLDKYTGSKGYYISGTNDCKQYSVLDTIDYYQIEGTNI